MKVLYLATERLLPDRLTMHKFLDEEIYALRNRGVEPHLLRESISRREVLNGVHLHPIPLGKKEIASCLARNFWRVPLPRLFDSYDMFLRGLLIEARIAEVVEREGIDLINSHWGWPAGFGGQLAAAMTRTPLMATFRGADVREVNGLRSQPLVDFMMRRLAREADHVTCFSDYIRKKAIAIGADDGKLTITRQGVDLKMFSPAPDRDAARRAVGALPNRTILTAGNLVQHKGIAEIIRAVARVSGPVLLLVAGEGEQRAELARLAAELGIASSVRFLGAVPWEQMPEYYAAADMFALHSRYEAMGNVIIEAMACARPVVTLTGCGPEEYIVHGSTGFAAHPDHLDDFAGYLQQLLDDPETAQEMGRRGREVAEAEYDYNQMLSNIIAVYERLCGKRVEGSRRAVQVGAASTAQA